MAFTPVKNDMIGNIKVPTTSPPLHLSTPLSSISFALTDDPSRKSATGNYPSQLTPKPCNPLSSTSSEQKSIQPLKACSGLSGTYCFPPSQSDPIFLVPIIHTSFFPRITQLNPIFRGLDFTSQALRHNLTHPSEELSTSFREAYTKTLKPHHSFVVKPVFSAAMSATPYRKDFMAKMGESQSKIDAETEKWLGALERQVAILKEFQGRKEAKW